MHIRVPKEISAEQDRRVRVPAACSAPAAALVPYAPRIVVGEWQGRPAAASGLGLGV